MDNGIMKDKILSFLQDKYICYPILKIKFKKLDFRPFYIGYPSRIWGWKWELEKYYPEATLRKLSVLEINFSKWHTYIDLKHRRKKEIYDYCFRCLKIVKQYTSDDSFICKECKNELMQ